MESAPGAKFDNLNQVVQKNLWKTKPKSLDSLIDLYPSLDKEIIQMIWENNLEDFETSRNQL